MPVSLPASTDPFAQLDREWAQLCARRRHRAAVHQWAAIDPALADLTAIGDFVSDDRARRHRYFGAVVARVRGDDDLARRVVVQMLVPGLVCLTNELAAMFRSVPRDDLASDIVTAAWNQASAISTGRSSARTPACILRNIRRDTIRWHRSLGPRTTELGGASVVSYDDGLVSDRLVGGAASPHHDEVEGMFERCETRLVLHAAVRKGVVDRRFADLIWRVVAEDRHFKQAATDVGISEPWAYQLRARTAPGLRAHLEEAA